MIGQRLIYGGLLLLTIVNWLLSGSGFACTLLLFLLLLPLFSILLSLPAIIQFHLEPGGTTTCRMDEHAELVILGSCHPPLPPFQGKVQLTNLQTKEQIWYDPEEGIPTRHAGIWQCQIKGSGVCDYLGLFHFRRKCALSSFCTVLPQPVPIQNLPDLITPRIQYRNPAADCDEWDYNLRKYRPGDPGNRIHWKLSAKMDCIMVRSLDYPERIPLTLTMELSGDPDCIDLKCGRLLWLGRYLLESKVPFSVEIFTLEGIYRAEPKSPEALDVAICQLLHKFPVMQSPKCRPSHLWEFPIGGICHEPGARMVTDLLCASERFGTARLPAQGLPHVPGAVGSPLFLSQTIS